MSNQPTSRRDFLRTIVLSAASIVMLPSLVQAAAGDPAAPPAPFVDLGPKKQFTESWSRVVLPAAYNNEVIYVRKAAADPKKSEKDAKGAAAYQAMSARCTHRGCVVDYKQDAHDFVCPCHHGIFDDNGVNVSGPPHTPMVPLQTTVSKTGTLLVQAPPEMNFRGHRPSA